MSDDKNQKTITRAELANKIYQEVGISQASSSMIVDQVFESIIASLANGEVFKYASFGSFYPKQKQQRMGRNPKTKEEAVIDARTVVCFYASNILKKRLNK